MKYNMRSWVDGLKGTQIKRPIPVLSFPCVQLLGVSVRELFDNAPLSKVLHLGVGGCGVCETCSKRDGEP